MLSILVFLLNFPHIFGCAATAPGGAPPVAGCPAGWEHFELTNFCYLVVSVKLTWQEAEDACIAQNSHLASIHSAEENDYLVSLTTTGSPKGEQEFVWFGAFRPAGGGLSTFQYTDGTAFDFTLWYIEGPNPDGTGDCVILQSDIFAYYMNGFKAWNDFPCDLTQSKYICKRPFG